MRWLYTTKNVIYMNTIGNNYCIYGHFLLIRQRFCVYIEHTLSPCCLGMIRSASQSSLFPTRRSSASSEAYWQETGQSQDIIILPFHWRQARLMLRKTHSYHKDWNYTSAVKDFMTNQGCSTNVSSCQQFHAVSLDTCATKLGQVFLHCLIHFCVMLKVGLSIITEYQTFKKQCHKVRSHNLYQN